MSEEITLDEVVVELKRIPKMAKKIVYLAIERATIAGKTAISKGIRQEYTVSAATIKSAITRKKKSKREYGYEGHLVVKGKPLSITNFRYRLKNDRGVRVIIRKGHGGDISRAFVLYRNARAGVYHRITKERLPIEKLFGPSVPQMAGNTIISETVEKRMAEVFRQRWEHESKQYLIRNGLG